jgi:hypothetical protein
VGCSGSGSIELTGTADSAKQVVITALETWKSGGKPEQLQSAKPAIRIADEDWDAGRQLKSYDFSEPPIKNGGHWRVAAVLSVSVEGAEERRRVAYAVTLEPSVSVVRADDVVE